MHLIIAKATSFLLSQGADLGCSAEDGGHSYGGWRAETSTVRPGSPTAREQYGHPSASTNLISSHLAYANSGVAFPSTPRSSDSQLLQSYTPATSLFDPVDMSGNSREESHMFPFLDTEHERPIHTAGGEVVKPIIHAMATKGFFTAQGYWTCYRRNYFALNAWYELGFMPHNIILFVDGKPIKAFALRLSAGIEGQEGKDVELVQYTPKRDLGDKTPVATTRVPPSQPMAHGNIGSSGAFMAMSPYQLGGFGFPYLPLQNERDSEPPESPTSASQASSGSARSRFSPPSTQGPQDAARHSFDRVQFKGATQNNGKRRASQQFYKLIVELLVDVRPDDATGPEWVRVAIRPSDKLVVRGRSPSHYKDSDGRVNPHTGRGGNQGTYSGRGTHGSSGGGHGGAPTYSPSAGNPGAFRPSYSYSNQSSISPGSNYSASSHSSKEEAASNIKHHVEPSICREEFFHMQNFPGYRYYPDTLTSGMPASQKMESPAPISLPGVASIEQDSKIAIADEYPSATLNRRYGHYTGYLGTETSDGWYAAVPGNANC